MFVLGLISICLSGCGGKSFQPAIEGTIEAIGYIEGVGSEESIDLQESIVPVDPKKEIVEALEPGEEQILTVEEFLGNRIKNIVKYSNITMNENVAYYDSKGKCIYCYSEYDNGMTYFTDAFGNIYLLPWAVPADKIQLTIIDYGITKIRAEGHDDLECSFQDGRFCYQLTEGVYVTSTKVDQEQFVRIGSLENESEDPNGTDSFRFDEKNRWYERNHREDSTSKFSLIYTDENIPVYSFYTISYKIDKTEFYYPNGVLRERIVLTYGPSGKATKYTYNEEGEFIEETPIA